MTKWISVKEMDLNDNDFVIGYALSAYSPNWYVGMLRYSPTLKGVPFWDDSTDSHPRAVSHYMKMPNPPEHKNASNLPLL